MPREKQKRGRRAEALKKEEMKRKREEEPQEDNLNKRIRPDGTEENGAQAGNDYLPLNEDVAMGGIGGDMPFYGLLDTEEQEYFSHANQMIDLNQFESDEDRDIFIERVYEEANGKELKIACSQSCSRLMERMISMSTPKQLKQLFQKFTGHFLHLSQHRFASHCCECLFTYSALVVTKESKKHHKKGDKGEQEEDNVKMEDLILGAVAELSGNWGYLLTERFASHTIRVLLLVLAGEPLDKPAVIASKKKETPAAEKSQQDKELAEKRQVPASFNATLEQMMKDLVAGLDETYIRALATHPIGNPVLQVLVMIELTHFGKSKAREESSLTHKLLPDENMEEGTQAATFVRGLLYDPVGSRLLETVIRCAPGKVFKAMFKNIFKERIGSYARNEIAAYVVVKILERLSKEDLQACLEQILPEIPSLVERSRFVVIRTLVERGHIRGANMAPLADALNKAFGDSPDARVLNILKLSAEKPEKEEEKKPNFTGKPPQSPEKLHGSLLAQAMVAAPGGLCEIVQKGLLALGNDMLSTIAKDPIASRVLQEALTQSTATQAFRRQLTMKLVPMISDLAVDPSGSHVADSLWQATKDIFFIKERFATELANHEMTLRDSFFGRAVWRNWSMDLYKRQRGNWKALAKGITDNATEASSAGNGAQAQETKKSRLDLARAKFAAKAAQTQAAREINAAPTASS
ncbi:Glutamate decarboxylase 2 [Ascosphaera pollenicola]|nr:Glutamate decarboxylase 2 [Ascosphaera pollenicola]